MMMSRTRREVSPRPRPAVTHRRIFHETAARVGPKDESTRGKKRKTQSDAEPVRNRRRTESVTLSTSPSSDTEQQPAAETTQRTKSVLLSISRDEFEENYVEVEKIGEGGFGTVYSGYRIEDLFPVAIKHIRECMTKYHTVVINGEGHRIPLEVLLMVTAAGGPEASVGKCAAISLLAWCDLGDEILLIMERPESCLDLVEFLNTCQMTEALALNLMKQLVAAAIQMNMAGIFHRDLKLDNILIEHDDAWPVPRVRIIDFGCGSFVTSGYHVYTGKLTRCIHTLPLSPSGRQSSLCWLCLRLRGSSEGTALFQLLSLYSLYTSGTSCYKPPEFSIRGTYEAGPTTVWQLGAILYEMLCQDMYFSKCKFHLYESLLRKMVMKLNVTKECKNFLKRCFSFNPDERITLEQMWWHPWLNSSPLKLQVLHSQRMKPQVHSTSPVESQL